MEIRAGSLSFPKSKGSGPRESIQVFNFPRTIKHAVAGLVGISFGFSPKDDHHLGRVTLLLDTTVDDDVVTVKATFGVRDWSGEWDDFYEGTIQFVVLAEFDTEVTPSNLSITGVEYNQATQFFRSAKHLDPANIQPDNSIRLVERKDTWLRVYVDTQTDPNRPLIGLISGIVQVRLPGQTNWTDLGSPVPLIIFPILDSQINRANASHTLNFLIPAAFCQGNLEYRVQAIDEALPDAPGHRSPFFQGTLHFKPVKPLSIVAVGIHYTGQGRDLPPLEINEFRTSLITASKMRPYRTRRYCPP